MFRSIPHIPPDVTASPEFELIILCAHTTLPEGFEQRLEDLLRRDINWPALVRLAIAHQVLPLVYQRLRSAPADSVPAEVMAEFLQCRGAVLQNNLFLLTKLFQILQMLSEAGIPCIPYKGPSLAVLAYGGNFGLRPFGDLDILVPSQAYEKTRDLFRAHGYHDGPDYGFELSMVDSTDGVAVDIHRAITPDRFPVQLDFFRLQSRLRVLRVADREIRSFGPEDMLVILCVQLAKDSWQRPWLSLSKVCDIAELLRAHPNLNWKQVACEGRRLRCEFILSFALAFSHELLGAAEPALELRRMPRRDHKALAAHVEHKIFNQMSPDYRGRLNQNRFHFKIREHWVDKIYPYLLDLPAAVRLSDRDREFVRLPALLEPLYYAVRPIRVLRDLARRRRDSGEEARSDSSKQ